jgi:hypothetical protein
VEAVARSWGDSAWHVERVAGLVLDQVTLRAASALESE